MYDIWTAAKRLNPTGGAFLTPVDALAPLDALAPPS